jgi:hypothetical protein
LIGNALTRGDILGCLWCVVAFAPVLLAPGYCLAWVADLFGFCKHALGERLAWSVAVSFGVMPIITVELAKYMSFSAVCWVAGLCGVICIGLLVSDARKAATQSKATWLGAGISGAWILFVIAALVDIGIGNKLYLSVTVFDHSLRTAFVDAVTRTGVPPANPLYWPGHAAPMRYYYFWYVLTATAARLGGATARQAMIASVVWAGFGLAAILTLYCRHFVGRQPIDGNPLRGSGRRWSRIALALGLLTVTGLDVLPALVKAAIRLPADPDMEWWSSDQVTSWMDSLIWVPHHIAGLVCCLFGFLLVWISKRLSVQQRTLCAVVAGISFASAFGLSTWVPVAFAMVLIAWIVWVFIWEPESRPRLPVLLGAGAIAVLALLPYLHELRAASTPTTATLSNGLIDVALPASSIGGNASHLLHFGIRRIIDPNGVLALPWFANNAQHPHFVGAVGIALQLILLFPGYFTEFGFYGLILVVAIQAVRRSKLNESMRTSLALTVASLLISTFLRSTLIDNNDFGWRSILIAQFFLLLLAVHWCEGAFEPTSRSLRRAMIVMLWIGFAGTLYQAVGLRLYLPVEDRLGRADSTALAERAMAWRRGFDAMDRAIPGSAIVQFNTAQPSDYFRFAQVLQVRRQVATAFPSCASAFGGDPAVCPEIQVHVGRLFSPPSPNATLPASGARAECRQLGAGYLIATRWDEVWRDTASWVWTLPAAVDTGDVRVLDCNER